jgi:F-type H+-transporting ATPase subunit a
VPTALKPLVGLIEFVSTIIVTPFSLTVRLMANMMAGHILLVTFALLTEALFEAKDKILIPVGIMPFFMLLFLTGFEILVAFLQAYIFTILTAVYINNATASHDAEHDTHETAHEAAPGPAPVPTS